LADDGAAQVAQEPSQRVQVASGATSAGLQGQITGDEIVDYLLDAAAGQRMTIDFRTDNPSAYFNLTAGSDPTALQVGSTSGNSYDGTLIWSGTYRVRVYLMRNAARRNETAS
jgi:hypothetical protein